MIIEELKKIPAWTPSKVEEFLAGIWFIGGFCAWTSGIYWAAWMFFVKALLDTVCALIYAVIEMHEVKKSVSAPSVLERNENALPPLISKNQ